MKLCKGCLRELPLDNFLARKERAPGSRASRCRMCCNRRSAIWRARHPTYMRTYRVNNPEKFAAYKAQRDNSQSPTSPTQE